MSSEVKVKDLDAPDSPVFKKCSRCRVKRQSETEEQLAKYATCLNCRTKRKVVRAPIDVSHLPNMYTNYIAFINKIKTNIAQDILDHRYRGSSDPDVFKRYDVNADIDPGTYQYIGKQLIEFYVHPLMAATGYRFPVRDYHKGGRKTKKITFMFICSQDQGKQRKSRSNNERQIQNKLKVEQCESKLSLNYSLPDGLIQILYNHKTHPPYAWKKQSLRDEEEQQHHHHHHHHDHYATAEAHQHQQHDPQVANNAYADAQHQEQQRAIQQAAMNLVDVQNLAQYNQLQNLAQYSQQLQYSPQQPQPQVVAYAVQQQQQAQLAQQQGQQTQSQSQSQGQTHTSTPDHHAASQQADQQYGQNAYQPQQSYTHEPQYDDATNQTPQDSNQDQASLLPHQQALNQIIPDDSKKEEKISDENIDKELIGLNKDN